MIPMPQIIMDGLLFTMPACEYALSSHRFSVWMVLIHTYSHLCIRATGTALAKPGSEHRILSKYPG